MPHAYTNLVQANRPYNKIVQKLNEVEFVCQPGDCYGYQNVVFSLVGDLLAKAKNQSYEALVSENIF